MKIPLKQKLGLVIFGLFLCAVLLEVGMRIQGAALLFLQEHRNRVSLKEKNEYRILCLGESTTVWGGEQSWPSQLEEILNQKTLGIRFKVINQGRHAIDSSFIISTLEENLDKYNPDMVITMMGLNDGDNIVTLEEGGNKKNRLSFTQFRIYKLAKLLWRSILSRTPEFKEHKLDVAEENNQDLFLCSEEKKIDFQPSEDGIKGDSVYLEMARNYEKQGLYIKAEEMFRKAIAVNPRNDQAYTELGQFYFRKQEKYDGAEKALKNAIELNPHNESAYGILGYCFEKHGKYEEAEEMYKKAIELSPRVNWVYARLGVCYRDEKKYKEAEEILKEAVEIDPNNSEAYVDLSLLYRELRRPVEEEEALLCAIKANPKDDRAYIELARRYNASNKYAEAEEMAKKAIEINPRQGTYYIELGSFLEAQEKLSEKEDLLKKAAEQDIDEHRDRLYGYLAVYYNEKGEYRTANKYFRKAHRMRLTYYPSQTLYNYRKLQKIVTQRGIKLVCVQYPLRQIEALKKIFDSMQGIIFVDNERIFKEALKRGRYEDYFVDRFAGDFGHGTPKGNRLLAENVANTILRECFN